MSDVHAELRRALADLAEARASIARVALLADGWESYALSEDRCPPDFMTPVSAAHIAAALRVREALAGLGKGAPQPTDSEAGR